jgi:hypothetical protein
MASAYFKTWYKANKARLAEKRKQVYRQDEEYRKRALERSSLQRAKIREAHPAGYDVDFDLAAELLEVSTVTLREWRRKDYFPEPKHHQSKMWFTSHQVSLIRVLGNFFARNGPRPRVAERRRLQQLVSWVHSNW